MKYIYFITLLSLFMLIASCEKDSGNEISYRQEIADDSRYRIHKFQNKNGITTVKTPNNSNVRNIEMSDSEMYFELYEDPISSLYIRLKIEAGSVKLVGESEGASGKVSKDDDGAWVVELEPLPNR